MRSYIGDGGRFSGVGLQGQASSHPRRLWLKNVVVNVWEKRLGHRVPQQCEEQSHDGEAVV